jgi:hypothetical protein
MAFAALSSAAVIPTGMGRITGRKGPPVPRILKQVANPGAYFDEWDSRVRCGWSDCENPGSSLHYLIECFSGRRADRASHSERPARLECRECRKKLFCCAQHRDYEARSHVPGQYGRLRAGTNARYL